MNCKILKHCLLAVLLSALVNGGKLAASPVVVPDYSFELWTYSLSGMGLADGATSTGPDVGSYWHAAGNGGINLVNPTNGQFAGTTGAPGTLPPTGDGTNYLFIGLGHPGYCWQTIGTLQSNTIYTLTVAVGNSLLNDGGQGSIALLSGSFPNGTTIASAPVDSTLITPGTFADTTLVFTTGQHASGPFTILLQGTTGGSGTELIYDNVRLDASPAPSKATALTPSASPSTNIFVGTVVTLTEDPAGATPLTYQWQTDNGTGGAAFSNISGANSTNLSVDTSTFSGTPVEYQVIVSNSLGVSTSPAVTLTASQGSPIITADTLPSSGSDVVGGQITFSVGFDGTRPLTYQWFVQDTNGDPATAISSATNSTFTLSDLQPTDFAIYFCTASNALGTMSSTPTVFVVNAVPPATNNEVIELANQTGLGGNTTFKPSWTISTNNDLIAGFLPSTVGPGNFSDPQEKIAGTPAVLTDGKIATLYPGGITSPDVVTGGIVSSGAGQYLIYTLPASATGWNLTNIVTYGGWADAGRDEQRYILYYSTVAAPSNFTSFADVIFNPSNPGGVQSATRVIITPSGAPALVKNVAALKFDFSTLDNGAENGFVGYDEIQSVSAFPRRRLRSWRLDTEPGSASDVVGDQITFTSTITGATSYQWLKVVSGVTNASFQAPLIRR